jgi:hypothetical protein
VTGADRHHLGRVLNEVPELDDRVRPTYQDKLFADLVTITGMDKGSSVLEVGCGTGQATRSVAALGCPVTAVEPGPGKVATTRRAPPRGSMALLGNVVIRRPGEAQVYAEAADPRALRTRAPRLGSPASRGRGTRDQRGLGTAQRSRRPVRPHDRAAEPGGAVARRLGTAQRSRRPVRPHDRAAEPGGAVARRRDRRRSPPLDVAVPQARIELIS